ncbi:hypothetical protein FRB99_005905 [Tulasnella sp. 403]|nr:hypothetical protein FRB99_005905 [Tulasnella sp. 403]
MSSPNPNQASSILRLSPVPKHFVQRTNASDRPLFAPMQNAVAQTASQSSTPTSHPPSQGNFTCYSSHHTITKGRYITSNDPRGYLPVYEYPLNNQWIMMDIDDGYAEIVKMVESEPDLIGRLRKVKEYGQMPKGKKIRRQTHTGPPPTSPMGSPSVPNHPTSQVMGQQWSTQVQMPPQRQESNSSIVSDPGTRPGSSYHPRGNQSPPGHYSPQSPYNQYLVGHGQMGHSTSQSSSPSHTRPDDSLTSPPTQYADPVYSYPQAQPHMYGSNYTSSPPLYAQPLNHPMQTQSPARYSSYPQEFASQPATPIHYAPAEYSGNYGPHGVSANHGQPCDTYPHRPNQTSTDEYMSHFSTQRISDPYSQYQTSPQPPHASTSYTPYGPAESNVRYSTETGTSAGDTAQGSGGGSSFHYGYQTMSGGVPEGQPQRTYSGSQHQASEYNAPQEPQAYPTQYSYQQQYQNRSYHS